LARASASEAWKGRGSIVKRSWPCETSSPSRNHTRVNCPPTSAFTDTVERGCTLPMARIWLGTSFDCATATETGTFSSTGFCFSAPQAARKAAARTTMFVSFKFNPRSVGTV